MEVSTNLNPDDEPRSMDEQSKQGKERKGSHPAIAGDQEANQWNAKNEGQRPAEFGDGNRSAARCIGDAVSKIGQQGRVEQVFAESGKDEGKYQPHKGGPEDDHCRSNGEKRRPGQDADLPPQTIGQ
jgi:hypothetical protein